MSDAGPAGLLGLRRNLLYATASSGSAVLLLGVLVLAARVLGRESYGRFSLALALATIGESLMDWGLHQVAIRGVARERGSAPAFFRNSAGLKLAPSVVMVGAITLLARWIRPDGEFSIVCLLLAVSAVMRSYLLTIRGVLQGLEHFGWDSLVVTLDRILLLALSAAVLLSGGTLTALAWAFVAARTLALVAALAIAGRHIGSLVPSFDLEVWHVLRERALPIGAFLILLNLYSYVDTVMLGVMSSDAETGLYNAAYRIYEGLTYAPAVLSAVLTPRLSAEFVSDRARHAALGRQGLAVSAGLAAVLAVAMWFAASPLLGRVFSAEFLNATRALQVLSAGLIVVFPIWILQAIAISMTAERVLLRTTAIGVLVNVAANLLLIPAAGRNGAALATVIGETVCLVLLLYGVRDALTRRAA
jgi:O-antigen/teichoic acid export membrane protein